MESRLARLKARLGTRLADERGQSLTLVALALPAIVLFWLGLLEYAVTTQRVQETVAAADLAAHAGAQAVELTPDGLLRPRPEADRIAADFFQRQHVAHARLAGARCFLADGRPACEVVATTDSAGFLLGRRAIRVRAVGYLAYGVTRSDQ